MDKYVVENFEIFQRGDFDRFKKGVNKYTEYEYTQDDFNDDDTQTEDEIIDDIEDNTNITQIYPKEFSVVKFMSNNGEKIAMCYSSDVSNYGTEIIGNLDFKSAIKKVKTLCKELNITEYDKNKDEIIGHIPNFMIDKSVKLSTSYIPLKESLAELKLHRAEIKKIRNEISSKIGIINKNIETIETDTKIPTEIKEVQIEEIKAHLESLKQFYKRLK